MKRGSINIKIYTQQTTTEGNKRSINVSIYTKKTSLGMAHFNADCRITSSLTDFMPP